MTGSPTAHLLSAGETAAAAALLARAWGEPVVPDAVEAIWGRAHILRLHLGPGRTVVLKRRRAGPRGQAFDMELAVLDYLNGMPVPVAPRLIGADAATAILLMEDLGEGPSLADSMLAGSRDRVQADLVAYARTLGSMHAWSMGRAGELAELRTRHAPGAPPETRWLDAIAERGPVFLAMAASLGVATGGVAEEIGQLHAMLSGTGYAGLVHGDACPDNVQISAAGCRIFDFETSGWGPVVFDAAYLLAPFPSCWCFARLPADIAGPAIDAYHARLGEEGISLGPDWAVLTTAALAGMIVARAPVLAETLEEDHEWGTTTIRPRLLCWLRSLTSRAGDGVLPRLQATASAMEERLAQRWPGALIPEYPALARPGAPLARIPAGWQPRP